MAIPEFLVQRLVVPNSFHQENQCFSFSLQNNLVTAHILSMQLVIVGFEIEPSLVSIQLSKTEIFHSDQIRRDNPFIFSAGSQATLVVEKPAPKDGKVKIILETLEVGEISFSIQINPKKRSRFQQVFNKKENPDVVKPTQPLFSLQQWERTWRDYEQWFQGSLPRNLVFIDNSGGFPLEFLENYPPRMKTEEVLDHQQIYINGMTCQADTFPKWWPNFGPGIAAAFLGSGLKASPDTVWFTPLAKKTLSDIEPTFDKNNYWWRRVVDITQKAVNRWGSWVSIGHTDLGGTLDILASLRGTEALLQDLIDQPHEVENQIWKIHDLWHFFYDELAKITSSNKGISGWGPLLFPGKGYLLQSDISYMLSPKMFERFVLPELVTNCSKLDYPFYHLDGEGQIKHLPMLLGISKLRGIQWVPGDAKPPPDKWLPILAQIRNASKLVQVTVSSRGALTITRELGNQGFLFEIIEKMSKEDEYAFVAKINSISL